MTPIRWIIFAVIAIGSLVGLTLLSGRDKIDVSNIDINKVVTEGDKADRIYGNLNAKVVLIEYADFQCPGCGGAYSKVKEIKETYKDDIVFVFRHFPLTAIHPNALAAASVAEAAGAQGKFWEMHDLLFESQSAWQSLAAEQRGSTFESYASQLGLNMEQFKTDLSSKKVADKIAYDRAVAGKANVSSTPTFFLNGKLVENEVTLDVIQNDGAKLKEMLNKAIKEAGGTVPATNQ